MIATEYLQQYGDCWRHKGEVVHGKVRSSKANVERQWKNLPVRFSRRYGRSGSSGVSKWLQLRLLHRPSAGYLRCCRIRCRSSHIAENCGVDSSSKPRWPDVWESANPVVWSALICLENERVALTCVYLNGIDAKRLDVVTVNLNNNLVLNFSKAFKIVLYQLFYSPLYGYQLKIWN